MHKVACLFSGGKDSVFAAFWAMCNGWSPILVTVSPRPYSMMFHHPNVEWTSLQAEAMGLPRADVEAGEGDELSALEGALRTLGASGIVTGAIASEYQKQRIDMIGHRLGVPTYSPLWHKEKEIAPHFLRDFEVYITAVSADGLGKELLCSKFSALGNRKGIHPLLEGGEGETFVADAPFFSGRIEILGWEKEWDGVRGVARITGARLVGK